jgi:Rrf2 family protein
MLQITRKADYALRLMVELGAHSGSPIDTAEVARRQEIPYQFLRKVVQTLVANGLLLGERGQHGGLSLARPSDTISMLDIVRAFGPTRLNRCTVVPSLCERRDDCAVFPVWLQAQTQLEQLLGRTLLSDLVRRQAKLQRAT